jgi:hypothetical protein
VVASSSVSSVISSSSKPTIFPKKGVTSSELTDEELLPHFLSPEFLRPEPQLEGLSQMDDQDFDDGYWLVPGMVPGLYWDNGVGKELEVGEMKVVLSKAMKQGL